MAEDPSEVWPGAEDVALPESENEDADLIEEQQNPEVQEDVTTSGEEKGKGKEFSSEKHGLMALPSEIRETYVFQSTLWVMTSTLCTFNLDHARRSYVFSTAFSILPTQRLSHPSFSSTVPGARHRKRPSSTVTTSHAAHLSLDHIMYSAAHSRMIAYQSSSGYLLGKSSGICSKHICNHVGPS